MFFHRCCLLFSWRKFSYLLIIGDIDIGAWINGQRITDLRFAGDISRLAESERSLQQAVSSLWQNSKRIDMKINAAKIEAQLLGHGNRSLI